MLRSLASDSHSGLTGSANKFNIFAFLVFVFNLLLGNGSLFVPYLLNESGLLPSCLLLLLLCFLSSLTSVWTLEVLCRTQALEYYSIRNTHTSQSIIPERRSYGSVTDELSRNKAVPIYEINTERKFEVTELCQRFLGTSAKWIYTFIIAFQSFLFLWTTATVASTTMTGIHWLLHGGEQCYSGEFGKSSLTDVPSCKNIYRVYIAVFGTVVIPMSCLRITQQKWFQIILAICRVLVIGLIFSFYIWKDDRALFRESDINDLNSTTFNTSDVADTIKVFNINVTILRLIPIITCSQLIHFAIPNLVHITRARTSLSKSIAFVFLFCWIVLTVHSVLLVVYFKSFLRPNAPHSWAYFTKSKNMATKVTAYIIQLSPVLNGFSVYPMLSAILADAMFFSATGKDTSTFNDNETQRKTFRKIKLLAICVSSLPIIFALEIANVSAINQFVSILSLGIVFAFPALLQYKSKKKCMQVFHCVEGKPRIETTEENRIQSTSSPTIRNEKHRFFFKPRNKGYPAIKDTPYSLTCLSSQLFSKVVLILCILLVIISFVGTLL